MSDMQNHPKSYTPRQIMVFTPPIHREVMGEFLAEFRKDWLERAVPRGGDPKRRAIYPAGGVWLYNVPVNMNPDVKRTLMELSESPIWVVFED